MTIYWPSHNGEPFIDEITLSENYAIKTHDYLHSDVAKPLFEIPAQWIVNEKLVGLLEPGCGSGWINTHLYGYRYNYMGIDTSTAVIDQAKIKFNEGHMPNRQNIHFKNLDWNENFGVHFDVDCILFMGVLTYGVPKYGFSEKNGSPENIVNKFIDKFKPKTIIIRETRQDQIHIAEGNKFEAVDLSWVQKYDHETVNVDIPMWLGNKVLIKITL